MDDLSTATHRGLYLGLIPGFISDDGAWLSASRLHAAAETILGLAWIGWHILRGTEPGPIFTAGEPVRPLRAGEG